jgi:hypothetical protein
MRRVVNSCCGCICLPMKPWTERDCVRVGVGVSFFFVCGLLDAVVRRRDYFVIQDYFVCNSHELFTRMRVIPDSV